MKNEEFKLRSLIASYQDSLSLLNYCTINKHEDLAFLEIPTEVIEVLGSILFIKFQRSPNVFSEEDCPCEDYHELVLALLKYLNLYGEEETLTQLTRMRDEMRHVV